MPLRTALRELWNRGKQALLSRGRVKPTTRGAGAVSEVTGGPPEDINMMPADINPLDEKTVFDGSELERPEAKRNGAKLHRPTDEAA